MELNQAIQERKSVHKFLDKKPDWRDIIECIDTCRFAPMAGNIFSPKFILVKDKDKIQKLVDAAQQPFVAQAHYVVVVCNDTLKTVTAYGERGRIYARQQVGATIQNFLLSIQEKGLSTCWTGHFVETLVKEALSIPSTIDVEAILPIGYEKQIRGAKPKRKPNINSKLFFDKYGNKQMREMPSIDV